MARRSHTLESKNQSLPMPATSHSSSLASPKILPPIPSPNCDVRSCVNDFATADDVPQVRYEETSRFRTSPSGKQRPRSPVRSPAWSPARSPAWSPAWSPARSPVRSPVRSPAWSPARSPAWSPAWSPVRSPVRSPAWSPARSPAWSPAWSPARSPAWSPARSPGATPFPDHILQGDAIKLYVGFIPVTATQQQLHDKFKVFGPIRQCTVIPPKDGMSYTFGFVQFARERSVLTAIQGLHGTQWGDWCISVAPSTPPKPNPTASRRNSTPGSRNEVSAGVGLHSVCVRWLPLSVSVELLGKLFCHVGTVKSVQIMDPLPRSDSTYAYVQLSTLEEARKAVKQLNNTAIGPVQRIQVEMTHTTTSWNMTKMKTLKDRVDVNGSGLAKSEAIQGSLHFHSEPAKTRKSNLHHPVISEVIVAAFKKMSLPCPAHVWPKSSEVVQDSGIQSTTSGVSNTTSASSTPVHYVEENHGIEQSTYRDLHKGFSEEQESREQPGSHFPTNRTDVCAEDPSGPPPLEGGFDEGLTAAEPLVEDTPTSSTPAVSIHYSHKQMLFHGVARGRALSKVLEETKKDHLPVGRRFGESQPVEPGIGKMQLLSNVLVKLTEDKQQPAKNENATSSESTVKETVVNQAEHVQTKSPQDSQFDVPPPLIISPARPKRERPITIAAVFPQTAIGEQHTLAHLDEQHDDKPQRGHEQSSEGERVDLSIGKSSLHHGPSQSLEASLSSSPLEQYQAVSSGDELEFSDSRWGRSSDELERRIALHQRNIHRWQVETKRIRQRNSAIREELCDEGTAELEFGWIEEAPDERLRAFNQIIEMHSRMETEADKLQRRELQHELILAKGEQKYMHDKLALMELRLELEAEETQDRLTLTKLENKVLQMKAEL